MTYRAAVMALPAWSDEEIMNCDWGRLNLAIEAAQEAERHKVRFQAKLAGFRMEEPLKDAESDEQFNQNAAFALMSLGAK